MKKLNSLLLEEGQLIGDFWATFLPIFRYVMFGLIIACAIVMIITTLMQSNDTSNSIDAFTGTAQESYYSQNKGASRDAILKKITIAMAITIFVCVILFFVSELIAGV